MAAYSPEARAALGAGVPDPAGPPGEGAGPLWWSGIGIAEIEAANRFIAEVYLPEHNARFAVAPEQDGSAFVACAPEQWREVPCRHEIRQVGNDNSVKWRGRQLQIPASRPRPPAQAYRPHFVRAKVRLHEYPDGAVALFRGPHRIADFAPDGKPVTHSFYALSATRRTPSTAVKSRAT